MGKSEKSRVFLHGMEGTSVAAVVQQCLQECDWESWVQPGATVVIKPNVCSAVPEIVEVANTGCEVVAALCEALKTRTSRICVGESGHMRQTPWEAFAASGYVEMAKKLDVELANFSEEPRVPVNCDPVGVIELPKRVMEADVFITVPKLKTHALTYFTGTLKNQWGCVPLYEDRLRFHLYIHKLLASLHAVFKPKMSLMDGILAMEGRGPVAGATRKLGVMLASRDGVALDATAMRLVGLEVQRSEHVVCAGKRGVGNTESENIEVVGDWDKYATHFVPPPKDVANTAMFYVSRSRWFVRHILANDKIYYPIAGFVKWLRRTGVMGG